ncbi:MAG TPA: hypothetical protein VNQ32_02110 [Steroidobacteraceae bacterium]|nr:hypothetical protein [Steroidobacteraceae bacterium]
MLLGSACTKQETAPAAATPAASAALPAGLKPAASMLDLMHDPIDIHANALWQAVYTTSTEKGTEDVVPATDEEWLALRRQALVLMEAANLLVTEGRPVAHPGQQLEGEQGEGVYTPQRAQTEIDANRPLFLAFSAALQGAAGGLVTAIDARNVEQYLAAGDALQAACENCHLRFWYPEQARPAP